MVAERETKSISVEDTFETDLVDGTTLLGILDRDARAVAARLRAAGLFARTVTIKVRLHDFSTHTRSRSLLSATNEPEVIADLARSMLSAVDVSGGVRLLGAGVAGLTDVLQEGLFDDGPAGGGRRADRRVPTWRRRRWRPTFSPLRPPGSGNSAAGRRARTSATRRTGTAGCGAPGLGRVTVRFETRANPAGPGAYLRRRRPRPPPALSASAPPGPGQPEGWPRTRPANRPWSSAVSGCHWTADPEAAAGVLDRLDGAVGGPGGGHQARVRADRLVVVARHRHLVADQPLQLGAGGHRDPVVPYVSSPGEWSLCPTRSGTCCYSSPPTETASSCIPRQTPSVGSPAASAAASSASSHASRSGRQPTVRG